MLLVASAAVTRAIAEDAIHVVIANTGASAVLIWNASPIVTKIVADGVSDTVANDRLERAALRAVAPDIPALPRAKTISVRILYDKTGDVSPVYGSPTFAGVERYATLTCDAAHARASAAQWKGLRDTDALPAWLTLTVVGTLPPR
jgi:hypothetical protein